MYFTLCILQIFMHINVHMYMLAVNDNNTILMNTINECDLFLFMFYSQVSNISFVFSHYLVLLVLFIFWQNNLNVTCVSILILSFYCSVFSCFVVDRAMCKL